MHIKHMHEMIEKLVDCTKQAIENDETCVGQYPIGDVVDMIKDLNEAEYYAHISKAMDEAKEEDEEQDKYMLKRIKEEYGDDEEGARRYYDDFRYMRTGRFAPKGRGSYDPSRGRSRRGYTEMMPMYDMMPEIYRDDAEWGRDMDRPMGRLYYTESGSSRGNYGNTSAGNRSGGNMNGSSESSGGRNYYGGDNRRSGESNERDYREGKSGRARRGYMESKELHSDNTPESKQAKMRELENYMRSLSEDLAEAIEGASPEERTMLKSKLQTLVQKM